MPFFHFIKIANSTFSFIQFVFTDILGTTYYVQGRQLVTKNGVAKISAVVQVNLLYAIFCILCLILAFHYSYVYHRPPVLGKPLCRLFSNELGSCSVGLNFVLQSIPNNYTSSLALLLCLNLASQ